MWTSPFSLCTSTAGGIHRLDLSSTIPSCNKAHICSSISAWKCAGILCGGIFTDLAVEFGLEFSETNSCASLKLLTTLD